jgi:hypothetical protein
MQRKWTPTSRATNKETGRPCGNAERDTLSPAHRERIALIYTIHCVLSDPVRALGRIPVWPIYSFPWLRPYWFLTPLQAWQQILFPGLRRASSRSWSLNRARPIRLPQPTNGTGLLCLRRIAGAIAQPPTILPSSCLIIPHQDDPCVGWYSARLKEPWKFKRLTSFMYSQ